MTDATTSRRLDAIGLGIYLVASDRTAHRAEPDLALPGEDAP